MSADDRAVAEAPDVAQGYDRYYATGLYDQRYPRPNQRVLRAAMATLPPDGRFLDLGAGSGRYCIPLLSSPGVSAVAADISPVARVQLQDRARRAGLAARLTVTGAEPDDLTAVAALGKPFDLCLLTFGVLGHVRGRDRRCALLRLIAEITAQEGRVLIGLPNARRRFRAEQAAAAPLVADGRLEPGDILYARQAGEETIPLFYHLYYRDEIIRDLAAAGLQVERLAPESILPERAVVGSGLIGHLDDLACRALPLDWSYGFLITARRAMP
jgi:SAM-dependent methyltransferase